MAKSLQHWLAHLRHQTEHPSPSPWRGYLPFCFTSHSPSLLLREKEDKAHRPPCRRFFATPSTALAKKKHAEGKQSGEPREMLSHAQTAANLLGTRGHVRMARTHGLLGSTFPVTALLALTWAKERAPALVGMTDPPSISQLGSGVQDQLRFLSARCPEAETELIHLPC